MFTVTLEKDSQIIAEKVIDKNICRIGNSPLSEIYLDSPFVSYEHLVIVEVFGSLFLIDKSLNGVYLDGKRIRKDRPVLIMEGTKVSTVGIDISISKCSERSCSRTIVLFDNLQKNTEIDNIILVLSNNGFIRPISDEEFFNGYIKKGYKIAEKHKDDLIRILRLESRGDVLFAVALYNSKYYESSLECKRKEKNFSFIGYFFLASIILLFLISLLLSLWLSLT